MAVAPRLSLVTLGVSDLERAKAFYTALGWEAHQDGDDLVVFSLAGAHLALFSWDELAAETSLPSLSHTEGGPGRLLRFRGTTLSINLESEADVDAAVATAVEAGATVLQAAQKTSWGGYNTYFADPDGHIWEIAFNPGWPIGPDGRPVVG